MPIHPPSPGVQQDRADVAVADRTLDAAPDRWRERDQDDLAALADHAQDSVTVFFSDIADVASAGFEDPQPEQAQHHHQREVEPIGRVPRRRQQRLDL
ncbi:hypothetical protein [Nocardia transvalensis]|uniref:hypothetical protein n=1 Tax=Nocardia transvalensis TaxID=37333 RepID=UPI001E52E119|nr:hypothetical protein [Nocardia transvalensis]